MNTKSLVRGALIIALALALQSIRLIVPLPPTFGAFIIGSFVHTMLVIARLQCGLMIALVLSLLLPCTAYLQGQLVLVILVLVVMLGNAIYVLLTGKISSGWMGHIVPALSKACFMSAAWGFCAMSLLHLDLPAVVMPVLFAMSVPQLVTGIIGSLLGKSILRRIS